MRVPDGMSVEAVACAPSMDLDGVDWTGEDKSTNGWEGFSLAGKFPLRWGKLAPVRHPAIRVHAFLVTEVDDAHLRAARRIPPVDAGNLIGSSRALDFEFCKGMVSSSTATQCYYGSYTEEEIILDRVFAGCP